MFAVLVMPINTPPSPVHTEAVQGSKHTLPIHTRIQRFLEISQQIPHECHPRLTRIATATPET